MSQSDEDSDLSQDDLIAIDDIIDEKARNSNGDQQEDTLFGPSVGDFIKTRKSNKKKKTVSRSHSQKLPEQFSGLFAEAQKCYILQDFNRAKLLLSELTKNIPEYAGIYNLLGLIYENENNIANACDCYFIASEILKKDVNKWFQTYELSCKLDLVKRELYCLNHLIRLQPEEPSFYEKRYQLLLKNEQYTKASGDIIQLCKLTNDVVIHIPEAYEICHKGGKESDLLVYLESQQSQLMNQLKSLANQLEGIVQTTLSLDLIRSSLDQVFNSFYIISQLYLNMKDYSKALNTIDLVNSICSIPLSIDMAVVYSVSLLHVGRIEDALEVIESLQIIENFSEEEASHSFILACALQECHQIDKALQFVHLLLDLPSYQTSEVYELSYLCYSEIKDMDHCILDLTKALEVFHGTNEKKQELALKLSRLYDEKGELLKSVEITTRYLSRSRHLINRSKQQTHNKQEYHQAIERLWALMATLPHIKTDIPTKQDCYSYIAIVDPLICCSCMLSPPSLYYDQVQPNEDAMEVGKILDIPAVLGQAGFLEILWQNSRLHCILGGIDYCSEYLRVIRSTFKFATSAYQNAFLLLCAIPSFSNTQMAVEAIRTLMMNCITGENQSSVFAILDTRESNEASFVNSSEESGNQTQLQPGQVVSLNSSLVFRIVELSLPNLSSYLSLLLPFVDYSISTNIFKQLQRQKDVHDCVYVLLGQIALYRNPSSCRQFFSMMQESRGNALVSLSLGTSQLTLGNSRTNTEKRETLLAAFTEIQNYAIFRQEAVSRQMASVDDMKELEEENGVYCASVYLPKELFQMEVLFNLGRAFHQISLFHIAVAYYEEVLKIADQHRNLPPRLQLIWNMYSLEKAAAYNLCIILKSSGSNSLATKIRRRYLCID